MRNQWLGMVLLLTLAGLVGQADANLVVNGGFENGPDWGLPDNWTLGHDGGSSGMVQRGVNIVYDGTASLVLSRGGSGENQAFAYQDISVSKNAEYDFSFYGRVTPNEAYPGWNEAKMEIRDVVTNDLIASLVMDDVADGADVWVLKSGTFNSGDREQVRVICANSANWRGNYELGYFDEVTVTPEPATMGMLAIGGLGILFRRKR